ncbi:hypothetical protein ABPG72_005299 [Tetrahymena utriculariae]
MIQSNFINIFLDIVNQESPLKQQYLDISFNQDNQNDTYSLIERQLNRQSSSELHSQQFKQKDEVEYSEGLQLIEQEEQQLLKNLRLMINQLDGISNLTVLSKARIQNLFSMIIQKTNQKGGFKSLDKKQSTELSILQYYLENLQIWFMQSLSDPSAQYFSIQFSVDILGQIFKEINNQSYQVQEREPCKDAQPVESGTNIQFKSINTLFGRFINYII